MPGVVQNSYTTLSRAVIEYPTYHLYFLGIPKHTSDPLYIPWYNTRTRYITSVYPLLRQNSNYFAVIKLNLSVDNTFRNLVVPSLQVEQGRGYAVYAEQPTLQGR